MSKLIPPNPRLPERASLEQLRKQAKELLRDARGGVDSAVARFRSVMPKLASTGAEATLSDAQHVLAREHGFESWPALVHQLTVTRPPGIRDLERLADALAAAYTSGDLRAVRELNAAYATSFVWDWEPEQMQRRLPTWYASKERPMALAVADAQHLVARQSGFDTWPELVASFASPRAAAGARSTPAFFRVVEERNAIKIRGPVSDKDWDVVFAAMAERHLTGLEANGQLTDATLERLVRLEYVKHLDIGGSPGVTDEGLLRLARMTNLESLHLGGSASTITDRGLEVLRHLPRLREFSAAWQQRVSDAGVANLAHCERLASVDVFGSRTGDSALAALRGKQHLRHIKAGALTTTNGLAALRDIPAFTEWSGEDGSFALFDAKVPTLLVLSQRPFAAGGLEALAGLNGLVGLQLLSKHDAGCPPLSAAGAQPLARLENLQWFTCDPADDAMAPIAAIPRLRALGCQDTRARDDGFVALSRSRTLEYIWGRDAKHLTGRGFTALMSMPSLRGLGTSLKHVDDAALATLAAAPALLELMPMGLRDDAFRHVGRCIGLEAIWCMYCQDTGDEATQHIAGLSRLKTYYAGATRITDESLRILGGMPTLEDVSLWDCQGVTDAGVAALATLPRLRKVTLESLPGVSRSVMSAFAPSVHAAYES